MFRFGLMPFTIVLVFNAAISRQAEGQVSNSETQDVNGNKLVAQSVLKVDALGRASFKGDKDYLVMPAIPDYLFLIFDDELLEELGVETKGLLALKREFKDIYGQLRGSEKADIVNLKREIQQLESQLRGKVGKKKMNLLQSVAKASAFYRQGPTQYVAGHKQFKGDLFLPKTLIEKTQQELVRELSALMKWTFDESLKCLPVSVQNELKVDWQSHNLKGHGFAISPVWLGMKSFVEEADVESYPPLIAVGKNGAPVVISVLKDRRFYNLSMLLSAQEISEERRPFVTSIKREFFGELLRADADHESKLTRGTINSAENLKMRMKKMDELSEELIGFLSDEEVDGIRCSEIAMVFRYYGPSQEFFEKTFAFAGVDINQSRKQIKLLRPKVDKILSRFEEKTFAIEKRVIGGVFEALPDNAVGDTSWIGNSKRVRIPPLDFATQTFSSKSN